MSGNEATPANNTERGDVLILKAETAGVSETGQ